AGLEELHLADEVLDLVGRDLGYDADRGDQRAHALRGPALIEARQEPGLAGVEDQQLLLSVDEVVEDAIRVARDRDAAHRVRHVLVEAREEAKAVLAGQVRAPTVSGPCNRNAACLAAQRLGLEDRDPEA